MLDWNQINTVFLDMDGTLLDLHYDNYFWLEHVPQRYGELHGMTVQDAKQEIYPRYRSVEGTLQWYSIDYWSRELNLDIPALKAEVADRITVHRHVEAFLTLAQRLVRRLVLLTNAHRESVNLKLGRTGLGKHFARIIIAHDVGEPKESGGFWPLLQQHEPYDPLTTLLIDDNLDVLRAAAAHGIAHLLAIRRPDTQRTEVDTGEFMAINDFSTILENSDTSRRP